MGLSAVSTLLNDLRADGIRTELDWVETESALPVSALDAVVEKLGFSRAEIDQLVLPKRTLAYRRAKKQALTLAESVRLARIARVALAAVEAFEDTADAHQWLRRPNRALNGARPVSLLDTDAGARLVEVTLGRIEHGLFS
ncbi:MAG TPA: antitoxin Xre/MbcA/ParS toxin-binding domain-containing protein [Longimicrobium sp.]|nr:antitoxin Xre/MbcA/ParS toxin-binding domain-containing protein [Longimicrobium sp.]